MKQQHWRLGLSFIRICWSFLHAPWCNSVVGLISMNGYSIKAMTKFQEKRSQSLLGSRCPSSYHIWWSLACFGIALIHSCVVKKIEFFAHNINPNRVTSIIMFYYSDTLDGAAKAEDCRIQFCNEWNLNLFFPKVENYIAY